MTREAEAFRSYLIAEERSPSTIRSYCYAVDLFFRTYGDLTKENLVDFKRHQVDSLSPKTAANRVTAMNCYCNFAGRYEARVKTVRIQQAPTVENVITADQLDKLTAGLLGDGNVRGYWMVVYLARTGARISEFVRMDKQCLETGICEMWTKGKIRRIRVPDFLIRESRQYFADNVSGDLMFPNRWGKQMTTRGAAQNIARWALKYGIPREVAHPHSFRHFFAIEFLRRNKDIALLRDLLGHESIDTTGIYLRMSEEQQRDEYNRTMEQVESSGRPEIRLLAAAGAST